MSTVYLIHFTTPYKHARHYVGWTTDLDQRLRLHRRGYGSRLIAVVNAAGITWECVRTWQAERHWERWLKDHYHDVPRLCPV